MASLSKLLALVLGCAGGLALACGTTMQIAVDAEHDFQADRTWEWSGRTTRVVDGEEGDEQRLDALVAALVDAELSGLGLEQSRSGADLRVVCTLEVTRRLVRVNETGATELLASHHASPSYLVQATTTRIDTYHDAVLRIVVKEAAAGERVVFRGEHVTRRKGDPGPHLQAAVLELLAAFPGPVTHATGADGRTRGDTSGEGGAGVGPGAADAPGGVSPDRARRSGSPRARGTPTR